jgi:hypothetical protein
MKVEQKGEGVLTILLNESLKVNIGSNNGTGNSQRTNEHSKQFYGVPIAVSSYAVILR